MLYDMIPCLTFVWFFSFRSTPYVVPIVLYNAKKVSNSNMHIKSKNQNTKRRMETKKSHRCEEGGTHLRISFWHLLMNLKNK